MKHQNEKEASAYIHLIFMSLRRLQHDVKQGVENELDLLEKDGVGARVHENRAPHLVHWGKYRQNFTLMGSTSLIGPIRLLVLYHIKILVMSENTIIM